MKKKAVRILVLAMCLIMLVGIAACNNGDNNSSGNVDNSGNGNTDTPPVDDGPVVITYMFWGDESEVENVTGVLNAFNAEHPHIRVEPWNVDRAEIDALLNTLAATGDLPDTGFLTEQMVIDWARAGFIASPTVVGERPLDLITFRWEGQPVAFSSANEVVLTFYNVDKFDAAGVAYPPTTAATAWSWDQFVDAAKRLTFDTSGRNALDPAFDRNNVEQYGVYIEPAPWMLEAFALANGGGFFNPNDWSDVIINQPAAVEAIQRIADLHLVHGVMPQYGTLEPTIEGVLMDHAAMMINGQWSVGVWLGPAKNNAGLNYGVGVLPSMNAGNVTIATAGLAVMYEGSKHPEAAAEFLAWYASPENNWGLIESGIWMPAVPSFYNDEAKMRQWADNPNFPPFDQYRSAVIEYTMSNAQSTFWYWVPGADPFLNVLGGALAPVWTGEQTAQQALNAAHGALSQAVAG